MSLLDIHVELALTNELLKRIADALDRAVPITIASDRSSHPLIGLSDISRITPESLARHDAERATLPFRASERVGFSDKTNPIRPETESPDTSGAPVASAVGQWDHDDPLDTLEEFDREWPNYSGVDR